MITTMCDHANPRQTQPCWDMNLFLQLVSKYEFGMDGFGVLHIEAG